MKTATTVDLAKLPASIVARAAAVSGASTARALVLAGLKKLAEQDAAGETLNTATRKAIKSVGTRGDKVFTTGKEAADFLRTRYA